MRLIITGLMILTIALFAQTEEYPHVQDNGGGFVETPGYRSYASIGQPVIGECGDGSHTNQAGYITGLSVYLAIEEKPNPGELPEKAAIGVPYPNPFNSACQIEIELPEASRVDFEIFDMNGRKIFGHDEERTVGSYVIKLDAGTMLSGVYFYRVATSNIQKTGKLILVK